MPDLDASRNMRCTRSCSWEKNRIFTGSSVLLLVFAISIVAISTAAASPTCTSCGASEWDPSAFLNSDEVPGALPTNTGSVVAGGAAKDTDSSSDADSSLNAENNDAGASEAGTDVAPDAHSSQFPNGGMLKAMSSVTSSDLVLDASGSDQYAKSHIKGAIHLPAESFLAEDGTLKSVDDLAAALGEAGVSREDSVVVYGDPLDSGEATFAVWVLSYLGQASVKLLDGSLEDWSSKGLPVESVTVTVAQAEYVPEPDEDLLANYEDARSGLSQIVDARSLQEFSLGRISGASLVDPADVVDDSKIRDTSGLSDAFSGLDKDRNVIAYSDDGIKASLLWFSLRLMGYDSSLYTWKDWESHQISSEPIELGSSAASNSEGSVTKGYKKLGAT